MHLGNEKVANFDNYTTPQPGSIRLFYIFDRQRCADWCLWVWEADASRVEPHNPQAIIYCNSSEAHTQSQCNFRSGNRSSSAARAPKTQRQSQHGYAASAAAVACSGSFGLTAVANLL